ncbi:hypothetical protein LZ32DRAFT_282045 [Colletotrichum eremochloae]|nr:hypothetical protein LZ32DRAFT_282045 [Colletotrichum eremochloae]
MSLFVVSNASFGQALCRCWRVCVCVVHVGRYIYTLGILSRCLGYTGEARELNNNYTYIIELTHVLPKDSITAQYSLLFGCRPHAWLTGQGAVF